MVHHTGVYQPPMVSDSQIPELDKTTASQINNDRISLGSPNHSGNVGGLSMRTAGETRFSHAPNTSGQIHHETGDTGLSCMAYLGESFTS